MFDTSKYNQMSSLFSITFPQLPFELGMVKINEKFFVLIFPLFFSYFFLVWFMMNQLFIWFCKIQFDEGSHILAGVYLKGCNVLKKDISLLSLSSFHFKLGKDKNFEKNGLQVLDSHKTKKMLLKACSGTSMNVVDWSTHDEFVAALSHEPHCKDDEKVAYQSDNIKGLKNLLKAWFFAHCDSISSNTGEDIDSLILGNETLIHIEVKSLKFGNREEVHASSNGSLENIHKATELPIEILYVLTIPEESHHGENAHEF